MTRINIVPPIVLADQHLIAEIKEINQLSGSFHKSINSKYGISDLPTEFTLNKGHVKFFYNKGYYLFNRFYELKYEAIKRGFDIHAEFYNAWELNNRLDLFNNWEPTIDSLRIIKERIIERIDSNPKQKKKDNWYRYYKVPILNEDYIQKIING